MLAPLSQANSQAEVEFIVTCHFAAQYLRVDVTQMENFDPNRYEWVTWRTYFVSADTGQRYLDGWTTPGAQGPGQFVKWAPRIFYPPAGKYWVGVQFAWYFANQWHYFFYWARQYFWQGGEGLFGSPDGTCDTRPHLVEVSFDAAGSQAAVSPLSDLLYATVQHAPPDDETVLAASGPRRARPACRKPDIRGTSGDDVLTGTPRSDVITAGDGHDLVFGGGGGDVVCAGEGNDLVSGGGGRDRLLGEAGLDVLAGDEGPDVIDGGTDPDLANGGAGNDRMRGGGDGSDLVGFFDARGGVIVNLDNGSASGQGKDKFSGFAGVLGSQYDDVLLGSQAANLFVPYLGDDEVNGGLGQDELYYLLATAPVTADLTAGVATGEGSDSLASVEHVVGSPQNDVLRGTSGINVLLGLAGDDLLDGVGGEDSLLGGEGIDECVSGTYFLDCENQPSQMEFPDPGLAQDAPPPGQATGQHPRR